MNGVRGTLGRPVASLVEKGLRLERGGVLKQGMLMYMTHFQSSLFWSKII